MTQLLSGHGYFCKYMFRMRKITQPNCIYDDTLIDDIEHTFFHCDRWRLERRNLDAKFGACTVDNFCDAILSSEENRIGMISYTEVWLKSKKFDLDERIIMDV